MISDKSIQKRYRAKAAILYCADTSSSHGLPNIFRTRHKPIRILWIVCYLASITYFIYSFSVTLIDFFHRDVKMDITIERKPSIEFPTVTICNKQPLKLQIVPINYQTIGILNAGATSLLDQGYGTLDVANFWVYFAGFTSVMENFTSADLSDYSYTLKDMLLNCRFNNIECTADDFVLYQSFLNGNCYKFNSGKYSNGSVAPIRTTSTPGRLNALKLELYTGDQNGYYQVVRSTGIILFVHNSSYTPLTDTEGVSLSAGFETNIKISQMFYNKLPEPYGQCVEDLTSPSAFNSDLFRWTIQLESRYNQKYCLQLCLQVYVISQCQCYDLYYPITADNTYPPCNFSVITTCGAPAKNHFFNSELTNQCFDYCPQECESITFDLDLAHASFPTPFYSALLGQYQNIHNLGRNFTTLQQVESTSLAVNVYYEDISYTVIDEAPDVTIDQLIGSIGGIIGLCIGASFLTFVELFEMAFYVVYIYLHPKNFSNKKLFKIKK